jgi:hypothetical protein
VVIAGAADADFALIVEEQLPAILEVVAQGELALSAVTDFSLAAEAVIESVSEAPTCAAQIAGSFGAKLEAAIDATVSVQASVSVSASVSGSAGAG